MTEATTSLPAKFERRFQRLAVDDVALGRIDRRLAVLGGHDDERVFRELFAFERRFKRRQALVDKVERFGEALGRFAVGVLVAVALELLGDADRLKIHAKKGGDADLLLAGAV